MISEKLLNKIFIYFILLLVTLALLIFFNILRPSKLENISYTKRNEKKDETLEIVSKALYLEPNKFDVSLDSIKHEIEVSIVEKRPDFQSKEESFEIKFKKSSKTLKVSLGKKLYVGVDKNGNFELSEIKTPLTISIKSLDKKNIKVALETDLRDFVRSDEKSKTIFFILEATDFVFAKAVDNREDLEKLASLKWFSKDELQKFNNKQVDPQERLEIDGKIVHLKADDILLYKNGSWQKPKDFENTQSYTIAKIKSIDSKILEIEAWDENSDKYIFALPSQPKLGFSTRVDQFITSARKRTITHISCQIEKQRVILKESDILIKKDGRWRLLKKDIDLDEIRNEELFYFDKIETKNNKNFLVGYLFNSMRTSYQKIEAPILSIAGQNSNKKRVIR